MILREQIEWFLDPDHNHLTASDGYTQPGIVETKRYLSIIEQIIVKTGAVFTTEPPISASIKGPLSELIDVRCDLSYLPLNYPEQKIPLCSTFLVSNYNLTAVNQLTVTLFPDVNLPWAAGVTRVSGSDYVKDYIPVNHYLNLIHKLLEEMSREKLLIPGEPEVKDLLPLPA